MRSVGRGKAFAYVLLALALGVAAYLVGVGSWLGQRAEASVLDAAAFTAHPPAPLSLVSVPAIVGAFAVIGVIAWVSRGFLRALWIILFAGAALAASQLLKQELLARPGLFELDAVNTFPSGHMTVFTVVVAGLIWAVPAGGRGVVAVFGAVLLGTVAWQLLEYGWHRPSDVLGAQALGLLAFALAALLRPPFSASRGRAPGRGAAGLSKVLGIFLTILGVALIAGALVMMLLAGWFSSDQLMLAASEVGLIGLSALVSRGLVTLAA